MTSATMFLWGVAFTAGALACSVEREIPEDAGGVDDAGPKIQLGQEFAFAGETTLEGDAATAFLPYTILVEQETAATWQIAVTSSDCANAPEAVQAVTQTEPNTSRHFPANWRRGKTTSR